MSQPFPVRLVLFWALFLNILFFNGRLPAQEAHFFSGGRKYVLEESTDWVAVEIEDNSDVVRLENTSKARGLMSSTRNSILHDRYRILVIPLEPNGTTSQRTQQREELKKTKGVRRLLRTFKNGDLPPKVETDEFVIRFENNVPRKAIEKLLAAHHATIVRPLGGFAPNGFVARVDTEKTTSFDAANALYGKPGVIFSHPDFIWPKERRFIPNDPLYFSQWHLNNNGLNGTRAGADIKAERAWEITRGDSNIIIAIIDDGVDLDHEDLQAPGKLVGHWDFVGGDNNPRPGPDDNHGTACAGLATAVGNNSIGVSGVAPNCRLMAVRLLGPNQTASMEAAAISHAKNNGADIISNSWGPQDGLGIEQPCPDVVSAAINDAVTNGRNGKGCVVVWAAGNGNESVDLDGYASHPQVLCVAASESNDQRSSYSDYGNAIDVTAPGGALLGDMVTTDRTGSAGYNNGNYTIGFNGTSAATPVVAGICALVLSVEPNLTWSQVYQRLRNTADFIDTENVTYDSFGHHPWYGYGRVNAFRAVGASDTTAPSVSIQSPANNGSFTSLNAAVGICLDSGFGVWRVRVALSNSMGHWWNWTNITWENEPFSFTKHVKLALPSGPGWSASLPSLPGGTYQVHAQAVDKSDNASPWADSFFTIDQGAPTIAFSPLTDKSEFFNFNQLGGTISEPGTVQFMIMDITDGLGGIRYWNGTSWIANGSSSEIWLDATMDGTTWSAPVWSLPARSQIREGEYIITARATDIAGNIGQNAITVTRTPSDTTLPLLTIGTPADAAVITNNFLPVLSGTASDPESGITAVTVYLLRFADSEFHYWNGSSWTPTPTSLESTYDHSTGRWESTSSLPSGANLPNGTYQVQVSAQNGEDPTGVAGLGTLFTVDYHPVYVWNGNFNSEWDLAINWTPANVPPTNAIVVINYGSCDARHLGNIQIHGVTLTSGTLQSSGMFVKKLNVSGGSLEGGIITIDGNGGLFNWTAGSVGGVINILEGATLTAISDNQKTLGAGTVVNNDGTIEWGGRYFYNYAYYPEQIATINNRSNAVFSVTTSGNVFEISYNSLIFNNEAGALFSKTESSETAHVRYTQFTNRGEIRSETGNLGIETLILHDGSRFTGNGKITTAGDRVEVHGEVVADACAFIIQDGVFHGESNARLTTVNSGLFEWVAGSLSGNIHVTPESAVYLTSNNMKTFGPGLVFKNHGYLAWFDNSTLYNYAYDPIQRATLENYGTFTIFGDGTMDYSYNASFLVNHEDGIITKANGSNTTQINWECNNHGEIASGSGVLSLNNGGTSSGLFKSDADTGIQFNGGTHTLLDGSRFSGPIHLANGTVTRDGTLLSDEANPAALEILNGTFNGNGSLEGPWTVNWINGTISGTLNAGTDVVLNVNGASNKNLFAATFNNYGVFNWNGGRAIYSYAFDPNDRSTFNNMENAVFNIAADGDVFDVNYTSSIFHNHPGALLVKSAGADAAILNDYEFVNAGEVRVESGTLRFGGRLTIDPGAVFEAPLGTSAFAGETILNTLLLSSGNLVLESGFLRGSTNSEGAQLASYAGSGSFDWEGGTISGIFGVEPGSVLNITGPATKNLDSGCVFNNSGTVNWHEGRIYNSAFTLQQRAVFNNLTNASFNIHGDGEVFNSSYNRPLFINHPGASIAKLDGDGITTINYFAIENYGEIHQSSGSLLFNDILTLHENSKVSGEGTMYWEKEININGNVFADCDIEFRSGTLTGARDTNGAALASWGGSGILTWLGGSVNGAIVIQPGSKWEISGANTKQLGVAAVIENFGTMIWRGPGKISASANTLQQRAVINTHGLFDLQDDGDAFESFYNLSLFNVQPGGRLQKSVSGGVSELSGFAFRNSGEVEASTGAIHFAGYLEIESGSAFRGDVKQTAGDALLIGSTTVRSGKFTLAGGSFNGGNSTNHAAIATLSGSAFEWSGGTVNGTLTFTPGTSVHLTGNQKAMGNGAVLNNYGNVRWSSGSIYNSAYNAAQPATINNRNGALWEIAGDLSLTYDYEPSTFNNEAGAALLKSEGNGTSICSWILNQDGLLDVQSGKFRTESNLTFGSNATTSLRVAGATPLTEYAQLDHTGALTPGGTLKLILDGGYVPTNNMAFTLATYASGNGQFALVELPALPKESKWQLTYGPTGLIAKVVAVTGIQNPVKLADGTFQFTITGDPASAAILEISADLKVWIPVMTNSPFDGNLVVSDPGTGTGNKFYRVLIME